MRSVLERLTKWESAREIIIGHRLIVETSLPEELSVQVYLSPRATDWSGRVDSPKYENENYQLNG